MKKLHLIIILIFILTLNSCSGQGFEKVTLTETDTANLYINDGDSNTLHYLKLVPATKIIGAIVIFPSGGESTEDVIQQINLPQLAAKKGILTIVPSINWGAEDRKLEFEILNQLFKDISIQYSIPTSNFILGGLSNGGVIALSYAEQAVKEKGSTFLSPRGVFGLDVPLDKAHLYEYCQREINRDYSEAGMNEAKWIINHYNQIYGGSPEEFPERYIEASVYSNGAKNGGNAQYLKNMPIRMYSDLDVDWLINERRRDLYDWNGTDITAMINVLKLMENKDANVIISMGKGVRLDGTKHPHSWSIMDNQDCLNWIVKLVND